MKEKLIIGRAEIIDLPELGMYNIEAKIDTGAETSVLHCEDYEVTEKNEKHFITCHIRPHLETDEILTITFPVHRERVVKSSFGQTETRHIFLTKIRMFDQLYDIKLSLRDRSTMSYPMLLGRNFISKKFLVDVSKKNLASNSI
ncbi:MAG TPA: RimK/LysX family protein [Sphingobacterium bovisgrunnientis]|uniref:ATP-dependent zinc protease family protein n=1 Tax=Sphingobacterium bovisgrunnientis TaxID=1874697 RepID=UPI001F040845|nr:RimK/LysX family protein [Sphingobacterium bovisgrunnientis]HLS37956.1 RimK/LysX family protein [Sphingobacterium bovisgrunnientis]